MGIDMNITVRLQQASRITDDSLKVLQEHMDRLFPELAEACVGYPKLLGAFMSMFAIMSKRDFFFPLLLTGQMRFTDDQLREYLRTGQWRQVMTGCATRLLESEAKYPIMKANADSLLLLAKFMEENPSDPAAWFKEHCQIGPNQTWDPFQRSEKRDDAQVDGRSSCSRR